MIFRGGKNKTPKAFYVLLYIIMFIRQFRGKQKEKMQKRNKIGGGEKRERSNKLRGRC